MSPLRRITGGLITVIAFVSAAHAQPRETYPTKPVRLIVSYASGNVTDILARLVADRQIGRAHV